MNGIKIPDYLKLVFWLTVGNLLIYFVRNLIIEERIHDILMTNLFHGFVPLALAFVLNQFYEKINNILFWSISALWVLYYPNSPYMISSLKHIGQDVAAIQDYDTLIIYSLATLSAFYGFLSLKIMYNLFQRKKGKVFANVGIISTLVLSCLGFYMGRVLFLYSADFLKRPLWVVKEVWNHLLPIGDNLSTYAIMFLFGWVQFMLILILKDAGDINTKKIITKEEKN